MIRALIFDFDGLILDTEEPIFHSWQELYRFYHLSLSLESWADTIGRSEDEAPFDPKRDLDERLGYRLDWDSIGPRRRQRELELIAVQPVLPGVENYLKSAKQLKLKIGLASSSDLGWVAGHLERLGLRNYFDCLRTSDDVRHTKPAPDLFLSALNCLEVSPQEAVVFEDSPNGILASRRAGIFCVVVPNRLTRHLNLDQANLRLNALSDLPLEELLACVEKENGNYSGTG
jgi:HAD superfamily hydrolase (TIGR01509 family)